MFYTKLTNREWAHNPQALRARMVAVCHLRGLHYRWKEIAVAIGRTPEQVRAIHAKARRNHP